MISFMRGNQKYNVLAFGVDYRISRSNKYRFSSPCEILSDQNIVASDKYLFLKVVLRLWRDVRQLCVWATCPQACCDHRFHGANAITGASSGSFTRNRTNNFRSKRSSPCLNPRAVLTFVWRQGYVGLWITENWSHHKNQMKVEPWRYP